MNERIGREEIALRLLVAHIRSGQPTGPTDVASAFALAMKFEDHSDQVGGRPYRGNGRPDRSRLAHDDDGE
jgi:hypothetical protein